MHKTEMAASIIWKVRQASSTKQQSARFPARNYLLQVTVGISAARDAVLRRAVRLLAFVCSTVEHVTEARLTTRGLPSACTDCCRQNIAEGGPCSACNGSESAAHAVRAFVQVLLFPTTAIQTCWCPSCLRCDAHTF